MSPEQLSLVTAIRGVWFLFKNGKWSLLTELGLKRRDNELFLFAFDSYVEGKRLSLPQVKQLVQECPNIVLVAIELRRRVLVKEINNESEFSDVA